MLLQDRWSGEFATEGVLSENVCQFHGGLSTGPKSEEGRERLRTLNLQHGCFTAEMKAGSRIGKLKLRYLEDFAIYSGPFTERTRGRKPLGYSV